MTGGGGGVDMMSACEGASGSCHQSIVDLISPTPAMSECITLRHSPVTEGSHSQVTSLVIFLYLQLEKGPPFLRDHPSHAKG